jgi:hypothetical protein
MIIIGADFHPQFQRIASVDTDTGEFQEKRLAHREDAEKFYCALAAAGRRVRVGMEAKRAGTLARATAGLLWENLPPSIRKIIRLRCSVLLTMSAAHTPSLVIV